MQLGQINTVGTGAQTGIARQIQKNSSAAGGVGSFAGILAEKTGALRFSAHAQSRLTSRNIDMTPEMMGKLDKAVTNAQSKGSRESLVLLKDLAFIVNVQKKMVVTAMDGESIRDNVFTNIDSTIIAG